MDKLSNNCFYVVGGRGFTIFSSQPLKKSDKILKCEENAD